MPVSINGGGSISGVSTLTQLTGLNVTGIITATGGLNVTGGSVGIGTDNPGKLLHISSNSAPTIRIENTDTTAAVDQIVGSLEFEGNDSSSNANGVRAKIDAEYRGVGAATALKLYTAWENETTLYESAYFSKPTVKFTTNDVERLRINSSGNIGIGTDSPDAGVRLQIEDSSPVLRLNHTSSGITDILGSLQFGSPTDPNCAAIYALHDGSTTSGALSFRTEVTGGNIEERVRISGIGSVGIGTDDPKQTLHVQDSSGRKIYPPPLFRARKNSADSQTLNSGTSTKITYTIEDVDTHGYYNTSNSRFTPTIPGWYFIEATVRCSVGSAGARFDMTLYIDGSASVYASGLNQQNSNDMSTGVATLVYLDGTQYVEVYVNQNSGTNVGMSYNSNAGGNNTINHFSAFLVSPD